ncbi:MAG: hypothetical protein WBH01_05810 [Dehalococcoidia bacterium]
MKWTEMALRLLRIALMIAIIGVVLFCGDYLSRSQVLAESPAQMEWSQTFGGEDSEHADSVQQTDDGGYIVAGTIESYGANQGDAWLIKTDAGGNEQWSRTFGESYYVAATFVEQTSDGGYIIASEIESYESGSYSSDVWLIKTNAEGDEQWSQTIGGTDDEGAHSVQQTSDGGYIIAGDTYSYGAGESNNLLLVKTDAGGHEQWSRIWAGSKSDVAWCVQQTSDGGYIVAGETMSYGVGDGDFWLIKTDAGGNEQWSRTFGGSDDDGARSVQQTSDGGYVIAGETSSYGAGGVDAWLIKTDAGGNEQWSRTFGVTDNEWAYSVQQTSDGGYIIAGQTYSYSTKDTDIWLIKTDAGGDEQWSLTFGGADTECAHSVQQTTDGGYIMAGNTASYGAGDGDFWLIKIAIPPPPDIPTLISPPDKDRIGLIGGITPTFQWSDVSDDSGVRYNLQVATHKDVTSTGEFVDPMLSVVGLVGTSYTLEETEALPYGTYYWIVQAVDEAENESDWTAPSSFQVGLLPLWGLVAIIVVLAMLLILLTRALVMRARSRATRLIEREKKEIIEMIDEALEEDKRSR